MLDSIYGLVGPFSSEGVVKVMVTHPPMTFSFFLLSSSVKNIQTRVKTLSMDGTDLVYLKVLSRLS